MQHAITNQLTHGMNRRDLDRFWVAMDGVVEPMKGTGEARYVDPVTRTRSRVFNARKKSASRDLVNFVRTAIRLRAEQH
jgi:hypothetical protein